MKKIRALIAARKDKIREMEQNFEPSQRIAKYKQASLEVIRQDYLKQVQELQAANKARMDAIRDEYYKKAPSIHDRAEHLQVLKMRNRAATNKQLERYAETLRKVPPGLLDVAEYESLAAEMRNRGMPQADDLASFTEVQRISMPYVHEPEYRALEQVSEKLKVYEAQAGEMLILSTDPMKIGKDDVIQIKDLDAGVSA